VKLINPRGLPWPVVEVLEQLQDDYTEGESDISVTTLIDSPRIRILLNQHNKELETDVVDRYFALQGTLMHRSLERLEENESRIKEHRFYVERNGKIIGGQIDLWSKGHLIDFKYVGQHSIKDGLKPAWVAQVNLYRYLLVKNDVVVDEQSILAMYRDWSAWSSLRSNTPDIPAEFHSVEMWSMAEIERYIDRRLELHFGDTLPECTLEEKWQSEDWALIKPGADRAFRCFSTEAKANEEIKKAKNGYKVVHRLKPPVRCERACPVRAHCEQYKRERDEQIKIKGL